MTSPGSSIPPNREIIVVDDDDEGTVAPSQSIDGTNILNSKKKLEECNEYPNKRQCFDGNVHGRAKAVFLYVDLCQENPDNEGGMIGIKKRNNHFSQSEQLNFRPAERHAERGLAERGEINADGRAAAITVLDAPPKPPTLFPLSPSSNEYKEVSITYDFLQIYIIFKTSSLPQETQ